MPHCKAAPIILSPELQALVDDIKSKRGLNWRVWICDQWVAGHDSGLLRVLRNTVGPSGLYHLK